jgi:hypothetical protein
MLKTHGVGARALLTVLVVVALVASIRTTPAQTESESRYVGSTACRDCHPAEYKNFFKFAKKAHSFESIERMRSRLTRAEFRGCLECHTTGYGRPGGFRSVEETSDLMNAGCEVCHGPGSRHIATGDAGDIRGKLTREDCEGCHNRDRVEAFNFKPLIYGGGH